MILRAYFNLNRSLYSTYIKNVYSVPEISDNMSIFQGVVRGRRTLTGAEYLIRTMWKIELVVPWIHISLLWTPHIRFFKNYTSSAIIFNKLYNTWFIFKDKFSYFRMMINRDQHKSFYLITRVKCVVIRTGQKLTRELKGILHGVKSQ